MRITQDRQQAGEPSARLLSSSLEHLETSGPIIFAPTRAQLRHHRPHLNERRRIMTAFYLDGSEPLRKRAQRIEQCCSFPLIAMKPDGKAGICLGLCRDRMCPLCIKRLSKKKVGRVASIIETFNAPRFATLTMAHSNRRLSEQVDRLLKSFKALRNFPEWKERVSGGVATMEVKYSNNSKSWHVHLHMVIDGEYFDQRLLSKLWEKATGDSRIVDIRAVHSRSAASNYIGKYITKPASVEDLEHDRICELAVGMAGRRTLIAFGKAHRLGKDLASNETKLEKAVVIGSIAAVQKKARDGCHFARHAVDILVRCGQVMRFSMGLDRDEPTKPRVPVEDWEERLAVRLCIRALEVEFIDPYVDIDGARMPGEPPPLPLPEPKWVQLEIELSRSVA